MLVDNAAVTFLEVEFAGCVGNASFALHAILPTSTSIASRS